MNNDKPKYPCEEANPVLSHKSYVPCGRPAKYLIKTRDPRLYLMCEFCAEHNVRNRGAAIILTVEEMEKNNEETRCRQNDVRNT